jgi:hypothetical protein
MYRRALVLVRPCADSAGCVSSGSQVQYGAGRQAAAAVYRITPDVAAEIPFRLLDSVNTLRRPRALSPLDLHAQLNAAAETHSRDMSVQNRPWHFGSDGSSPLVRVQRVGYPGKLVGENDLGNLPDRAGNPVGLDGPARHPRHHHGPAGPRTGLCLVPGKTARSGGRWSPAPERRRMRPRLERGPCGPFFTVRAGCGSACPA